DGKISYAKQQEQKGRAFNAQTDMQEVQLPAIKGIQGWRLALMEQLKGKRGGPTLTDKIRYVEELSVETFDKLNDLLGAEVVRLALGWHAPEQAAKLKRMARIGITSTDELRAAVGEYNQFREGRKAMDPVKKAEMAIVGQKVGIDFFPTPKATAARMVEMAGIEPGMRVLEPSAGNGNIADAAKEAGATVEVVEVSSQLRDILAAKGYAIVGQDFEDFTPAEKYDVVLMNPPFGNRKDGDHIRRAYGMLKPGGRLIAIAGEGIFSGSDTKATEFREWLDSNGAEVEKLPEGSFKSAELLAQTGANARIVTLEMPQAVAEVVEQPRAPAEASIPEAPTPKEPIRVTPQLATDSQIKSFIAIAADSVRQLRSQDVERVLTETPAQFRVSVSMHIKSARPDLAAEVDAVMAEVMPKQTRELSPRPAPLPSPQAAAPASAKAANAIGDFGAKIEGAAKDRMRSYIASLDDASNLDIAGNSFSKTWPEPDYEALIKAGADPFLVAFARAARDAIPLKPRKTWQLKGWVKQVEMLRGMTADLMSGKLNYNKSELLAKMVEVSEGLRDSVGGSAELYESVGHSVSLKGIRVNHVTHAYFNGTEISERNGNTYWTVEGQPEKSAFSNMPKEFARGKTRDEAIANFKDGYEQFAQKEEKSEGQPAQKFIIYRYKAKPNVWVIGKKHGKRYFDLKSFDSSSAAKDYLASNAAVLAEQFDNARALPSDRGAENAPRVGADHRSGADVTGEQFKETFGFRGGQFGNTMPNAERQEHLNRAYDALMDLAGVIGVPPKALSLNGELGLAFGARGKGGKDAPSAHYEGDLSGKVAENNVVINLTRRAGAGALAHEWFHAADNYFARMRGQQGGHLTSIPYVRGEGVRPEMVAAFKGVMDAIGSTGMRARSNEADAVKGKAYYGTSEELAARAFESYIAAKLEAQGGRNDYLANIVSKEYWDAGEALRTLSFLDPEAQSSETYPYPLKEELAKITPAFDKFFDTVQTRTNEAGNVAMFSRTQQRATGLPFALVQKLAAGYEAAGLKRVNVARNLDDLPAELRGKLGDFADVRGVYFRESDQIFVFSDNIHSGAELEFVVMHEAFHRGLGRVIGAPAKIILRQMFHTNKKLRDRANLIAKELKIDRDTAIEEALADMAGEGDASQLRGWPRLVELIREWMSAIGFKMAFSDAQIETFVSAMTRAGLKENSMEMALHDGYVSVTGADDGPASAGGGNQNANQPEAQMSRAASVAFPKITAQSVIDSLNDRMGNAGAKIGFVEKHIGTQYAKAMRHPAFKAVFDKVQDYIGTTSSLANAAAANAPTILPRMDTMRDLTKTGLNKADAEAVAGPVFEGTLGWVRVDGKLTPFADVEAQAAKMTDEQKAQQLLKDRHVSESELKRWKASPLDI
ncbi:MAG: LPD5 domain-containing protein, partial [Inhella sp.]